MAKANAAKHTKPSLAEQVAKLSVPAISGILIATVAILGGIFYGLVYMPYSDQAKELEGNLANFRKNIRDQTTALQKHQAVGTYQEPISASFQYIQKYLPQEEEMPRLVQMVAEIASRAGLTDGVTLFAPKLPAIIQANYAEIPFTMNLEGEFLTVLNFLYDFSRMDRIVNVTDITVGTPKMVDERREIFHVQVKCSGSTYRSLTEAELGAAGQPGNKKL